MNVTELKKEEVSLQLQIEVEKVDYAELVKKNLNNCRRKAELKGFRKGMAPMSIIEKLYGRQAILEEVNTVVSNSLNEYIEKNQINIIGEPMPVVGADKNDYEKGDAFTFTFDLMLSPKIDTAIVEGLTIPYHNVELTDALAQDYTKNLLRQFGELVDSEVVAENDYFLADFNQEGGVNVENTYVSMMSVPADKRDLFLGHKTNDVIDVNVNEIATNETDRAGMLKIKKEELATLNPEFKMTIKSIKHFQDAVIGEEFYNKAFGEGVVKNEDECKAKVMERMKAEYAQESEFAFENEIRKTLVEKADIKLADDLLKRFMFDSNEGKFTMEQVEKEYPLFIKDFAWQLICQTIAKEQGMKIQKEDVMAAARGYAAYQFAMYGMANVPQEQLNNYAESLLKDTKTAQRMFEKCEQDKVFAYLKGKIAKVEDTISLEDLRAKNQQQNS